jgi:DNA-binding NtrC family response regulator
MPPPDLRILIADDERAARYGMAKALAPAGYQVDEADDGDAALAAIRGGAYDLVFLDLTMPGLDGQGLLRRLCEAGAGGRQRCDVVVVTADERIGTAIECVRLGAADYLTKPYEVEHVRAIARRVAERVGLERRVGDLEAQLDRRHALGALVGVSRPMRELYDQIARAAAAPVDVLVRGETGTGKELIARELHRLSPRAAGPFVAVNTAAVAESLAESELFGHVRGAFTGAAADRKGVFEQADGGTLFLDEVGDMPRAAQAKILRALQERTVQPVGSSRGVRVDVRVVSATHQDLTRAIADGHFRQDLYYRIKGVELFVPPLRSRREDVILLANYFLERLPCPAGPAAQPRWRLSPDATDALLAHAWPGNVRELEHAVTAAAAMARSPGGTVRAADLALPSAAGRPPAPAGPDFDALAALPLTEAKGRLVEQFERHAIARALAQHAGNVSAAARQLGVHRQSLQQKMDQLGITRGA